MDILPNFFRKVRPAGEDEEAAAPEASSTAVAAGEAEAAPASTGAGERPRVTVEQAMHTTRWRLARERGMIGAPVPSHPAPPPVSGPAAPPMSPTGSSRPLEVVLLLDDVLPRIPTDCLQPGLHDPDRELRFPAEDLVAGIARGRATLPLSKLAERYPDIFQPPRSASADLPVYLPLPKLLRQLGREGHGAPPRRETPAPALERTAPPVAAPAPSLRDFASQARVISPPTPRPAPAAPPVSQEKSSAVQLLKPSLHGDLLGMAATTPTAPRIPPPDTEPLPEIPPLQAASVAASGEAVLPPMVKAFAPIQRAEEEPEVEDRVIAVPPHAFRPPIPEPAPQAEPHAVPPPLFAVRPPAVKTSEEEVREPRATPPPFRFVTPASEGADEVPAPSPVITPFVPPPIAVAPAVTMPPGELTPTLSAALGLASAAPEIPMVAPAEPPAPPIPIVTEAEAEAASFPTHIPSPVAHFTPPPIVRAEPPASPAPSAAPEPVAEFIPPPIATAPSAQSAPAAAQDPLETFTFGAPAAPLRIAPMPPTVRPPTINLYAGVGAPPLAGAESHAHDQPSGFVPSQPPTPPPEPEPERAAPRAHEQPSAFSAPPPESFAAAAADVVAEPPPLRPPAPEPPHVFVAAAPPIFAAPEVEPEPIFASRVPYEPPAAPTVEFPLELIEQAPLQAIFMTEDTLDLPRISQLSASLPGVSGCLILAGESLAHGGERPAGLDAQTLRDLSKGLTGAADAVRGKLAAENTFTLYGGNRALSIISRGSLCVCAVHGTRGFLPGVRERLTAVADTLARGMEEAALDKAPS